MNPTISKQAKLSRRDALKTLAAAAGVAGLSLLPERWPPPLVEVGALPVHAAISGQASYRVANLRELTPCENMGKHHIFINVLDSAGQGINGVLVRIQWSPTEDGYVVARTGSGTYFDGSVRDGLVDFAMFRGAYSVTVMDGVSEVASGLTPDYAVTEYCGSVPGNYLYHLSYEVIFERSG